MLMVSLIVRLVSFPFSLKARMKVAEWAAHRKYLEAALATDKTKMG